LRYTFSLIFLFCFILVISAQEKFNSIISNRDTVRLFEKYELTILLDKKYANPFDPNEVNLKCKFISPSGKTKLIDGFYYVDYKLINEDGALDNTGFENWKIRFTPN
jgi:hypothetical protein